ncbi:MAG: flagellar basal-body rod protein FlgG [Proteobacteria bacterium]|nr:flagellar basal-body rod protein FlgG [Pseudomonadota bacterium]MCH8213866.1 flagellar basal-body rod protein FlgG [Pseudomonadota bacterium]
MDTLSIAATGMFAQQVAVEVIANNLANMNTTGFKRRDTEFSNLLVEDLDRGGFTTPITDSVVPAGVESGYGVELAGISRIHEQGNLKATGNTFDLAIQGQGFFQITLPTGETAYTRDGTFQINGDGEIVTHIGYTLAPGIAVPVNATDVTVNTSGEVMARVTGQINLVNLGQIQLVIFPNPAGLENTGGNLLVETAASGPPTVGNPAAGAFGSLVQGFLETSNVNPIQEIANLIKAQRAYELNAKVIETAEKMASTTTTA